MGVGTYLIVGSKKKATHSRATLRALVVDLIRDRIVDRPCALFSGKGLHQKSLGLGQPLTGCDLHYQGDASAGLLAALDAAPKKVDLGFVFSGFALDHNVGLAQAFELESWVNNPLLVFALTKPRTLEAGDLDGPPEQHDFQTYVYFQSDRGPEQAPKPLAKVVSRHLGPLRELCGYY